MAVLQGILQSVIQLHDSSLVATAVAVIRRGPDRHECVIEHLLMALHNKLMRAADQINGVLSVKLLNDFATEEIASAARADHPAWDIIGVGPH